MIVMIMGATGSGKTTIGTLLAQRLGWEFADADNFHPAANIEKMSRGIPLNDEDRAPWLAILRGKILAWKAENRNAILACSALKRSYRNELLVGSVTKLIYLKGRYELFAERIASRKGHFAKTDILAGQFADLEEPEDATVVDTSKSPDEIVVDICNQLGVSATHT